MKFLKRHAYALLFTLFLMGANVYSLLKVFVIPSAVSTVSANTTSSSTASSTTSTSTGKVTKTDTTYKDDNMDIKITTGKTSDTTYYVADIKLSSADYLKTALAQNTYGTNITETTSSIAQQNNAIFAINGDYYGANQSGYVIKNGQVYRDTDRNSDYEDLAVYSDGSFKTFKESDTTAQKFGNQCVVAAIDAKKMADGSWHVFVAGGRKDTGRDLIQWAQEVVALGAGEILLTSMDKDGTKSGFDLEMLNRVAEVVDVPIIASGGAGNIEDIVEVFEKTTATGALAASIFHFGEVNIGETKQVLANAGIEVR
ncbi:MULTISPECIES: HisA/HisF-related TIM barrel protein [Streptococcus]|uniref:HisA/HisF-related TIM barrel protein n=1 Tax=Streptococcus TaxID=1301 RepID=UPI000660D6E8|nr:MULTISPECIES: HisA/HisF-related TIM barrel protein [Streptococcus]